MFFRILSIILAISKAPLSPMVLVSIALAIVFLALGMLIAFSRRQNKWIELAVVGFCLPGLLLALAYLGMAHTD
jgi:hypothetical protein